ncbi:MAG: hypothetical protein QXS48_02680 [Candidatus Aenigmatarchaeota archaeon]
MREKNLIEELYTSKLPRYLFQKYKNSKKSYKKACYALASVTCMNPFYLILMSSEIIIRDSCQQIKLALKELEEEKIKK